MFFNSRSAVFCMSIEDHVDYVTNNRVEKEEKNAHHMSMKQNIL